MASVKINSKLNLVIPVDLDDGKTVYVHSTPVSLEIFETYYKAIALAWTRIYSGGFTYASGPRIAKLILKEASQSLGIWDGPSGVNNGLMGEIRRISNVIMPALSGGGWTTLPLDDVLRKNILDPEDVSEIENAICFFIVASAMHTKAALKEVLEAVAGIWGAQFVSLNSTEYKNSLPTLTVTENTGEIVEEPPATKPAMHPKKPLSIPV